MIKTTISYTGEVPSWLKDETILMGETLVRNAFREMKTSDSPCSIAFSNNKLTTTQTLEYLGGTYIKACTFEPAPGYEKEFYNFMSMTRHRLFEAY